MADVPALAVTLPLLALCLAVALRGGDKIVEASVAVVGAAFAVLVGAVGTPSATEEVTEIFPTVVFLCVLFVLAHLAANEGVFSWAASLLAHRSDGAPTVLLRRVFAVAAIVTAVLSLDSTVLLLTPVVVTSVLRARLPVRPYAYACAHLSNSASLLMPVSNLTNLLAFAATGLSFLSFTAVMALPWLAAITMEYAVLHRVFRAELRDPDPGFDLVEHPPAPRIAIAVVAATVVGFGIGSLIDLAPIWPAAAGALVLAVRQLANSSTSVSAILEEANLAFALFVLGLAVIVRGVQEHGLGDLLSAILPEGTGLLALLAVAGIAAVLANVVNNLPATLALLPAAVLVGTPAILAVLIGVNVGSNLSYFGSLANLIWRRVLAPSGSAPSAANFTRIGLLSVPATLIAATTALWISLRLLG